MTQEIGHTASFNLTGRSTFYGQHGLGRVPQRLPQENLGVADARLFY